jgi:hypothetical protein
MGKTPRAWFMGTRLREGVIMNATYKIINIETGAVTWTEDETQALHMEDETENGEPVYDVELYCDHTDARVCEGLGH